MKFLIVFVSVLVLVAQGKAAPSSDEERVSKIEPEVIAGQEAGGVEPQQVFGEEVQAIGVFGAEKEPRAVGPNVERNINAPESVYIPMTSRACLNSVCVSLCQLLGFKNGVCVSILGCQCYN